MKRAIPAERLLVLPDLQGGLANTDAEARLRRYGPNQIIPRTSHGWATTLRDTLRDLMLWFLLITSALFFSVGQRSEALGLLLSHHVAVVSEGITKGAERTAIGVRTFLRRASADREWASALLSVVRYAEGMRSTLALYVRADLQMGHAQGDFRYVDEGVAMTLVVTATMGAMAAILDGDTVEQHDSIVAEMVLLALGVTAARARRIACLPMPPAA